MPTAAYMRKYRARRRGKGRRPVKFPEQLLCECGRRALYVADVPQLSADGRTHQVTFPVCRDCHRHFRPGELKPASVSLTLTAQDYYDLLDHIGAMREVALQALGRANQRHMETATERTQAALNMLHTAKLEAR